MTAHNCSIDIDFGGNNTQTCTVSGRTLTFSGLITSSTAIQTLTIYVGNVKNPQPAVLTSRFLGSIGNDNSGNFVIDSKIQLTAAQFQACSVSFSPSIVNTTGQNMIVTVTPTNALNSGNTMVVQFQSLTYANQLSSTYRIPISGTLSCTNNSANVLSNVACIGDVADIDI